MDVGHQRGTESACGKRALVTSSAALFTSNLPGASIERASLVCLGAARRSTPLGGLLCRARGRSCGYRLVRFVDQIPRVRHAHGTPRGHADDFPFSWGDDLRKLPPQVELLEVRADRIGHVDPDWLRSHFNGQILFTLRSAAEGGDCGAALEERHRQLRRAARRYDLVDLEAERDLVPELLAQSLPTARA